MSVITINGYHIDGLILGHDRYTILMVVDGKQQLVYKSAVSTIVREGGVTMADKKPAGASYYAESSDGRFRFIAWGSPPETGDKLCLGLTGKSENQLVRAILAGEYDSILTQR